MYALFYFAGYHHGRNEWWRIAITVEDHEDDRYAEALDILRIEYPELTAWRGQFICLTPEKVFKEL